jgi:hypothetical protein
MKMSCSLQPATEKIVRQSTSGPSYFDDAVDQHRALEILLRIIFVLRCGLRLTCYFSAREGWNYNDIVGYDFFRGARAARGTTRDLTAGGLYTRASISTMGNKWRGKNAGLLRIEGASIFYWGSE